MDQSVSRNWKSSQSELKGKRSLLGVGTRNEL